MLGERALEPGRPGRESRRCELEQESYGMPSFLSCVVTASSGRWWGVDGRTRVEWGALCSVNGRRPVEHVVLSPSFGIRATSDPRRPFASRAV